MGLIWRPGAGHEPTVWWGSENGRLAGRVEKVVGPNGTHWRAYRLDGNSASGIGAGYPTAERAMLAADSDTQLIRTAHPRPRSLLAPWNKPSS